MPKTPHSSLNLSSMAHLVTYYAAVRLKKLASADAQTCSASPTDTSMVFRPRMEISRRDPPVVPIRRAGTPAARARARTSSTLDALTDTTIREALSLKSEGVE